MKTRRQLPVVGLAGAAVDAAGSSWPVSARSRCNSRWPTVHLVMIDVEPVAGPLSVIRGEVDS